MFRRLMITPWFGKLPDWFDQYLANIELLKPFGYDWLITTNLGLFKQRVKEKLGLECPIVPGTGKLWDYRASLGVLFEEELTGYEFWGHADFDCVFGRIDHFVPDAKLAELDIWSNHADPKERYGGYICGPWTLYRNVPKINTLFMRHPRWREILSDPTPIGWVEHHDGFTGIVDAAHNAGEIKRLYTMYQTADLNDGSTLRMVDGALYEGPGTGVERMMSHFKRTKTYPPGVSF